MPSSSKTEFECWPEILQVLQQTNDGDDKVEVDYHHVDFSNGGDLWPKNAIDLDPFCDFDEDGWNLYHDDSDDSQNGVDDWYSFVENTSPPDTTIASITGFYVAKDEGRQEVDLPRGPTCHDVPPFRRQMEPDCRQHKLPTPIVQQQEKNHNDLRHAAPAASSPSGGSNSKGIRSSLVKLVCFSTTPEKKPQTSTSGANYFNGDFDDGIFLGARGPSPSTLRLGAADASPGFAVRTFLESAEESSMNPAGQRMHNSSKIFCDKGVIVSAQELDHYCGSSTILGRHGTPATSKHSSSNGISTVETDDGSIGSCSTTTSNNSSMEGICRSAAASSLAGCTIDSKLAKALAFRCTPEKLQQKRMDSQDYGLVRSQNVRTTCANDGSSVARQVVADRRQWLLAAFKKSKQEEEEERSNASEAPHLGISNNIGREVESDTNATINAKAANSTNTRSSRSSSLAATIDKFGGRPMTAVQRRKQQWEQKLAQKRSDNGMQGGGTLRIQTQWECNTDGSYKKRTIVKKTAE